MKEHILSYMFRKFLQMFKGIGKHVSQILQSLLRSFSPLAKFEHLCQMLGSICG